MATDISHHPAPAAAGSSDRQHHKGRKPFSSLMKRLVSLKNHTASNTHARAAAGGRAAAESPYSPYYPYKAGIARSPPPSTSASAVAPSHISFGPDHHGSAHSISSTVSASASSASGDPPGTGPSEQSRRPAPSATTATTATTSAFSSPTPSVRSLTTTLTTIQSTAPGSLLDPYPHYNPHPLHHHNPNAPPTLFQHQFPSTPAATSPASPGPVALSASTLHPLNYSTATAGGLLTDNASIITLASSSKRRRRRHSLDTDASVRALAPSSLWGGSRESLPLSVLSGAFDGGRIPGERGSFHAASSSFRGGDAGSSSGGMTIAGNRDSGLVAFSRRSSAWVGDQVEGEHDEMDDDEDDEDGDGDGDDETIERRRSLCGDCEGAGEGQSMKDGSSNVGVWHGVFGRKEGGEKGKLGE